PLTERVGTMLKMRKDERSGVRTNEAPQVVEQPAASWVFISHRGGPFSVDTLDKMHARVRAGLKLSSEFVLHSLRHTMLTRLGESGADAFTIMRVAGHSTVVVSQRYVHPSPESVER